MLGSVEFIGVLRLRAARFAQDDRFGRWELTGSRRAGALCRYSLKLSLSIRGKREGCEDVLFAEIGKVAQNFLMAHPGGEVSEHVCNRDAQTAYAGFAAALSGLHCDDLRVIHSFSLRER